MNWVILACLISRNPIVIKDTINITAYPTKTATYPIKVRTVANLNLPSVNAPSNDLVSNSGRSASVVIGCLPRLAMRITSGELHPKLWWGYSAADVSRRLLSPMAPKGNVTWFTPRRFFLTISGKPAAARRFSWTRDLSSGCRVLPANRAPRGSGRPRRRRRSRGPRSRPQRSQLRPMLIRRHVALRSSPC